jgi:hypothetical protein
MDALVLLMIESVYLPNISDKTPVYVPLESVDPEEDPEDPEDDEDPEEEDEEDAAAAADPDATAAASAAAPTATLRFVSASVRVASPLLIAAFAVATVFSE